MGRHTSTNRTNNSDEVKSKVCAQKKLDQVKQKKMYECTCQTHKYKTVKKELRLRLAQSLKLVCSL